MSKPLGIGIIGMGGFAGAHHSTVRELERNGECCLVCTCDPRAAEFADRGRELGLAERGVRVFADHLSMLDACRDELDVVTIPTPVPLHAPMHRACVERGIAVYLEKPPTLDWRELEEMLAVEAKAEKLTNVGFNNIVDPQRQALKQRMIDGEFGKVREISILALWPRADQYYARANWPGRLMLDGRLVLDSCLGNGMAHLAHDALFWGGDKGLWSWGEVIEVFAELYRAHEIEGTDTIFLQAGLRGGPRLSCAMSHACCDEHRSEERVVCARAALTYVVQAMTRPAYMQRYDLRWHDGRVETGSLASQSFLRDNLGAYLRYVRGVDERPVNRLVDCRPFVHLNDLVYVAARRITTIPEAHLVRTADGFVDIPGIDRIAGRFLAEGLFPSGQGLGWAAPGDHAGMDNLPALRSVVEDMVAARGREIPKP